MRTKAVPLSSRGFWFTIGLTLLFAPLAFAQLSPSLYSDGRDGDLTVAAGTTRLIDEVVTNVVGSNPALTNSLRVATTSGFRVGDLVLVVVSRDPNTNLAQNTTGIYEWCRVTGVADGALTLLYPRTKAFDANAGIVIQALRAPQYLNVIIDGELTCRAWDGAVGGIVPIVARIVTINAGGAVHADGKGYRGGVNLTLNSEPGMGWAGEGTTGRSLAKATSTAEIPNGGGGAGVDGFSGGGGGGYGTVGLNGASSTGALNVGRGAIAFGMADLGRTYFGGGGGSPGYTAGGGSLSNYSINGGNGGGIVKLVASQIVGSGRISAGGLAGGAGGTPTINRHYSLSGGGGGAGGGVFIAGKVSGSLALMATEGSGGARGLYEITGATGSAGGAGGVGRIRVDLPPDGAPPLTQPATGYIGALTAVNASQLKEDDGDSDGMPTWWEVFHGLNPLDANDAKGDLDSDAVDNLMEFRLETMPTKSDTDGDGVNDGEELALYGTNPRLADTDGDGMPDKWEIEHGLDPRRKDAIEDRDFDFLTNLDEFQAGTKPNNWDSDSNGVPDFLQTRGKIAWAADYDRNDRLISVRYEQQSFGFRYDGNGNLIGQSRLGRDGDGDGLPDSWEYAHGLNPFSAVGNDGAAGDPDGDGWTNLQEWTARTNPRDSNIRPGANGAAVATFDVPFTPTRFVSATGQFDGSIGDEFVVGADGAPGSQSNFVRIYSEIGGWTYEQVDVGAFGVTSIVVGQVSGRPRAIYLGLRRSGGGGRVVELRKEGSVWQLTTLAESQSDAAYVHGIADVAGSGELLLSLVSRLSANFGLFRASYAQNYWRVGLLDATDGVVAAGAMGGRIGLSNTESRLFRSIKSGGISLSRLAPHVAFDDFATTTLDSTSWSSGGSKGGASGVHSFSVSVTDGKARVFAAWDDNSGDRHGYAFLETQALWAAGERGLEIAISQAASSGPGPSPSATIRLGTTQIYSLVPGQIFANVRLQLVRTDSEVYFRSGSAQLGWSNWAAAPSSSTLRFETGSTTDFNVEGSAELLIDSIRYLPIGTLAEAGVGPTDFITPNAAYRTATQKWYFKTPSALSWVDAQAYAAARQGDLVTVESAPTNTWLAGWANGEVWIGYMRDFSTSPWRWLGGNPSSYTSWGSGQPGTGTNQIFALANAGAWSSAAGTEVKAAVFESRAQALEVRTSTITQALGSRLAWAGRTLQAGAFVANDAALQSIVEAYVEDRDGTNTLTFGDEFVVAESVVGTAQSQPRTLVRRSVAPTGPALGFALAGVRLAGATNDTLITAEPDGQLVAWHPTPAGTEMRRQLLSAQQIGRVWHSLEKIAAGYSGDGLLGLVVSPSLPQRAEIVLVGGAELSDGSNTFLAQTEPSARIMTTPSSGGAVARLDVRVWDSESSPVRLFVQYQSTANGPWLDATLSTVNNLPAVSATALATAPGGVVHQATWNAGANLGATFRGNVSLRVRAADATAVGAWSDSVIYSIDGAGDTDGDGILDAYEDANGLNRLANDANLDLDGDGIGNLDEYLQGTAPNNAGSAKYSLTVSGVGATVSKNPDQVLYDTGTTVNVTATQQPATLSFIGWAPTAPLAGGGFAAALTANPLPVLMNAHKSVTAYAGLPLAAAVETPSLTWTTGGHTLWYGQSSTTHDGLDAVQATGLGASGNEAWMETTVTAPGSISWRAKLELAAGGGAALQVLVSDTVVDTTSVSGDWAAKIVAVNGAGATKVRWRFVRQAVNAAAVNDSAFVDTVAYVAAAKPVITTQPQDLAVGVGGNAGFSVIATSETPLSYRWQRKTAAQAEFADLNTAS